MEERRRLCRQQILLEGVLRDFDEELDKSLDEERRQEALSGWSDPDLTRHVEALRTDVLRVRTILHQVRQAIAVAGQEVDRSIRCRWQAGVVRVTRREAS